MLHPTPPNQIGTIVPNEETHSFPINHAATHSTAISGRKKTEAISRRRRFGGRLSRLEQQTLRR